MAPPQELSPTAEPTFVWMREHEDYGRRSRLLMACRIRLRSSFQLSTTSWTERASTTRPPRSYHSGPFSSAISQSIRCSQCGRARWKEVEEEEPRMIPTFLRNRHEALRAVLSASGPKVTSRPWKSVSPLSISLSRRLCLLVAGHDPHPARPAVLPGTLNHGRDRMRSTPLQWLILRKHLRSRRSIAEVG